MLVDDRGHQIRPHTADVIIDAWAPDLPALIEEAVVGLTEVCLDTGFCRVCRTRSVSLGPGSAEALLLAALDEVIYHLDTSNAPPVGATVHALGDGRVEIDLDFGDPATVEQIGAAPKAISRSGLEVEATAAGARCAFIVDV